MRTSMVKPASAPQAQASQPAPLKYRPGSQSRLAAIIDTSPRIAVQAQRKAVIFGAPVQKKARAHPLPHPAEDDELHQFKTDPAAVAAAPAHSTPVRNHTGLPNQLKAGVEALSGMSLDHVRVHRNSNKPAQLHAHAYAQGSEIHLAPGQEKHLPHETWHVVQQAQGRVKPTIQMKGGVAVNDDVGLEREADLMGEIALQFKGNFSAVTPLRDTRSSSPVTQRKWLDFGANQYWNQLTYNAQLWRDKEGKIWYEVGKNHSNFRLFAGIENKRTQKEWLQLGKSQTTKVQSMLTLALTQVRIDEYDKQSRGLLTKKEREKNRSDFGVEKIDRAVTTDVLASEQKAERSERMTGWRQVTDDFGSLRQKGDPVAASSSRPSTHDDQKKKEDEPPAADPVSKRKPNTKFYNMFRVPELGGDVDAVVMLENFRESARPFFASDAFFHQWMRVQKIEDMSLKNLPKTFPKFFYRNHIDNEKLKPMLEEHLRNSPNAKVDILVRSHSFDELAETDNVKSTQQILDTYNALNAERGIEPVRITAMTIYPGPGIRFTIG